MIDLSNTIWGWGPCNMLKWICECVQSSYTIYPPIFLSIKNNELHALFMHPTCHSILDFLKGSCNFNKCIFEVTFVSYRGEVNEGSFGNNLLCQNFFKKVVLRVYSEKLWSKVTIIWLKLNSWRHWLYTHTFLVVDQL